MTIPPPDRKLVARFRRDVETLAGSQPGPLGAAVSGGADSLALLLLANAAFPARVRAISIDHGLRPAAAEECRFVGEVCARLGLAHDILAVTVTPRGEGMQAAARHARLMAFGGWCQEHRVPWLMTAHHADDQAETVLMRLARGSGVGGLAGIGASSPLAAMPPAAIAHAPSIGAALLRPLLGWTRRELRAVVRDAGLVPVADPANDDARFDRTRFRALLRETDLLDAKRLAAVARHCRDAEDALAFSARQLARAAVRTVGDVVEIDPAAVRQPNNEIMRRIMLDTFARLGAAEPRGPQLMRLIELLHAGRAATLAGIKVTPGPVWRFTRAPPRRAPSDRSH